MIHIFLDTASSAGAVIRVGRGKGRPVAVAAPPVDSARDYAPMEPFAEAILHRADDEDESSFDATSLPRSLWESAPRSRPSIAADATVDLENGQEENMPSPAPLRPSDNVWGFDPNEGSNAAALIDTKHGASARGPSTRIPGITASARRRRATQIGANDDTEPTVPPSNRLITTTTALRLSTLNEADDDDDDFVGPVHCVRPRSSSAPEQQQQLLADRLLREAPATMAQSIKVFDGLSVQESSNESDGDEDYRVTQTLHPSAPMYGGSVIADEARPIAVNPNDPLSFVAFTKAPSTLAGVKETVACTFDAAPTPTKVEELRSRRLLASVHTGLEQDDMALDRIVRRDETCGFDTKRPWNVSRAPKHDDTDPAAAAARQVALRPIGSAVVPSFANRLEGEADLHSRPGVSPWAIPAMFDLATPVFDDEIPNPAPSQDSATTTTSFDVDLRSLVANAARYKSIVGQLADCQPPQGLILGTPQTKDPRLLTAAFARALDAQSRSAQEEITRDDDEDEL